MKCFSNNYIQEWMEVSYTDFFFYFSQRIFLYTHIYIRKIKTFQNTLFLLIISGQDYNLEPRCMSVMFCLLFLIIWQVIT